MIDLLLIKVIFLFDYLLILVILLILVVLLLLIRKLVIKFMELLLIN